MIKTGQQIVKMALREIGVLDAVETLTTEDLAHALELGSALLDSWRAEGLTIGGVTIATYSLVLNTQSYTIGSGGTFNQDYPERIEQWSVVPDDDATDPVEIPMGRPDTAEEWQQIRVKSLTGSRPTRLYFDRAWAAGLGNVLVYPVPDNGDVDVKLYCRVPEVLTLVSATSYDLRPGFIRAIALKLAVELSDSYGSAAIIGPTLVGRAADALATLKRANIKPRESPIRAEFAIGGARRRGNFNIYTGGS